MTASPLRLTRERIFMYGGIIALACLVQVRFVVHQGFGDWTAFWAAGATAGTSDLLDPQRHGVWLAAHHLLRTIFPYLPGAAWLWAPFRPLSHAAGYAVNFAVMATFAWCAATIAAPVYRISRAFAALFAFAWAPLIAALATGQNSPLGLFFALVAVLGIATDSPLLAGAGTGLLLYKLPYALPFVLLLIVRRNVRAVAIVAAFAAAWYLASVAATAGDWQWPVHYAAAIHGYFGPDFRYNAAKELSIPSLLMRAGVTPLYAFAAGAGLLAAALPLFARLDPLQAASFAPLIVLAVNPHTLPYDLAFALPAIYYLATHLPEPLRTRWICASYVAAPLWLLSGVWNFDVLGILCDVPAILWLVKGYHESTFGEYLGIADSRDRGKA